MIVAVRCAAETLAWALAVIIKVPLPVAGVTVHQAWLDAADQFTLVSTATKA